jgi:hypothetical protein
MMTELVAGASSSQAQPGAVTPETPPTVNAIITAGSGVPEVLPTEDASFAGGGTAMTGDNDGDGNELEVVLRHPNFRAPRDVSLSEVMSMAHFAHHQAQDVRQREWVAVEEEWQRLLEWCSLLKERTSSKKEKAAAKRE